MDKWFYVYGIPTHIHSDKGQSFGNEIVTHLYVMYIVEQSTTMPYNPHGNAKCKRLNSTLIYLFMLHSTTSYQPYELMFGHKTPTIWMHGLDWPIIMTTFHKARVHGSTNSINTLVANRHVLKRIKISVEKISLPGMM